MKSILIYTALFICLLPVVQGCAKSENPLRKKIADFVSAKKAAVGAAVFHLESGDTVTFGNERYYPMQSVYKFHLALAVMHEVDKGKMSLADSIRIPADDLKPHTWSPMRKKYAGVGDLRLPLEEIMIYSVSYSDNNACDILFRLMGGPAKADQYVRGCGVKGTEIKTTEEEMHKAWGIQYTNKTTPYAAVSLLEKFFQGGILSEKSKKFLLRIMTDSFNPGDRIKGFLPEGTIVAHKTGTSIRNEQGLKAATNDIGIITLPDGTHLAIAVLVSDAAENDSACAEIIARISKMAWDHYTKMEKK